MKAETNALPALARTPEPPYYAVIFASTRKEGDLGYGAMAERMEELVQKQRGFLGFDGVRGENGLGITVAYFDSLDAVREWKANEEHLTAQILGRERWYAAYSVRICRVERAYGFESI